MLSLRVQMHTVQEKLELCIPKNNDNFKDLVWTLLDSLLDQQLHFINQLKLLSDKASQMNKYFLSKQDSSWFLNMEDLKIPMEIQFTDLSLIVTAIHQKISITNKLPGHERQLQRVNWYF